MTLRSRKAVLTSTSTGLIYRAMKFLTDFFRVVRGRADAGAGWPSEEMPLDKEQRSPARGRSIRATTSGRTGPRSIIGRGPASARRGIRSGLRSSGQIQSSGPGSEPNSVRRLPVSEPGCAQPRNRAPVAVPNAGRADQGAELHQGLVVNPGVSTRAREQLFGDRPGRPLSSCGLRIDRGKKDAVEHPCDVRVHECRAPLVGERRDGAGRVRADSREITELLGFVRNGSAVAETWRASACRFLASVVAQPPTTSARPGRGASATGSAWEASEKRS